MSTGLKIVMSVFGVLLAVVVVSVVYGAIFPERILQVVAPDSIFNWENFKPLSREPGLLGISPLIWTALFVVPIAVGLPILIYIYEKKRVPAVTRGFMAAMRMVILLLLYLLLAGPSLVDTEKYVEGSKVAILIDDSLSMGGESREFPIFNVLDDRESNDVKATRDQLERLGMRIEKPPAQGFVTLTEDELAVRSFVRKVVRQRAGRLMERLKGLHGGEFMVRDWQQARSDVERLSAEADLLQSALSGELAKPEGQADEGEVRRLETALNEKLSEIQRREARFAELLGGEVSDPEIRKKRALVENLLETVHPEGPRRWDIACELVTEGAKLAVPTGGNVDLLEMLKQKAVEIEAKGRQDDAAKARRMKMVRYFVFSTKFGRDQLTDEAILEIDPADLDFRAPQGRLTEIDKALAEVRRYYTDEDDLATVMLLSDGRDTTPATEREETAAPRVKQGMEVVTVAIGNPKPVKVLELLSVSADREILKGDYLDFKLKIRADKAYRADPASGKPGIQVKVILCEDSVTNPVPYEELNGRPVRGPDGMTVELGSEELAEVKIRFKPGVTGKHVYFLKLNEDRLPDEDTYRNNVKEHYVEIIDRKIKVLYLEQRPRYQWRTMNEALKRDKKLEYQGFLFDAQDGWTQPTSNYDEEVRKTVKPLGWPFFGNGKVVREKEEFFKLNYDVIILGDIDPASPFWRFEYWDWIEEWVSRQRGGLILLAGQAHNPSGYANNEKARSLYPVELDFPSGYESQVNRAVPKYWRLTPAGRAHEVHRLSSNQDRNDELWGKIVDGSFEPGELHGLYWYQVTGGIKPAPAVALSRVARDGAVTGEGEVLTAAMPYGNGMCFYCGSDDTWLWRQWVGDHWFYRFWQNTIRFVASRRLAGKQQRVDVYTDKTKYQVSEDVKIYVELLGDIYSEVVQNQLKELKELPVSEDDGDSRKIIVEVQARSQGRLTSRRVVLREVSWSPNLFEGIVEANEPGQFDVWVRGYEESRKTPHRYTVIAPIAELRNLTLDLDGLKDRATKLPPQRAPLAYQDGKRVYLMTDAGDAALEIRERENEVKGITALVWDRNEDRFGLRTLLLVLLILLLAGEWLTRKLVRMV
ncbi:MAG: VWA domain-containing protein [Planctomycetes bacterium]|nr:VWA domain-containing protein [Planctomycetota bacterium]